MKYTVLLFTLLLGACASTPEEEYLVSAYDSHGRLLSKRVEMGSNRAGVPFARDTLCKVHPKAIIRVHNKATKQMVKEYPPYKCR
ncbi:Uncharacterised protein [Neisseria animaloris]|uniref:Lipoprotein n=1 Tax=Neisseria animaloris TaxID=326522 RepID=A0A1X3CK67_9NEIS|nr:hypothetical protein [Neisseria animaloris]OSI08169.1 hypothetical protein BWD08_02755 [Neisseria animaloris]VEH86485.1 Uncharacterised protein [Neisseria animaloris]VEJ21330.1 Uncharacterised protein [Neisseria animaloris]